MVYVTAQRFTYLLFPRLAAASISRVGIEKFGDDSGANQNRTFTPPYAARPNAGNPKTSA